MRHAQNIHRGPAPVVTKSLPFAWESTLPFLPCLIEQKVFCKSLKLQSYFPLCRCATNDAVLTICVQALSQYVFNQRALHLNSKPWQFSSGQLTSPNPGCGSFLHLGGIRCCTGFMTVRIALGVKLIMLPGKRPR